MITISNWIDLPKVSLKKLVFSSFLYFVSAAVVALGQPDRFFLLPLCSYIFGYALIFYLLLTIESRRVKTALFFIWAWAVQLFQVSWMATTYYFGSAIVFAYLAITLCLAMQFAVIAYCLPSAKNLSYQRIFALAAVWTILEWSRLYYFCGFPFNTLGLVLTFDVIPMQIATVFGVYGLTFWVILTALIGAKALAQKGSKSMGIWILALSMPFIFGHYHFEYQKSRVLSEQTVKTAVIQTGLFAEEKWEFPGQEEKFVQPIVQWQKTLSYLDESGEAIFDYIILPEGAFHGDAYDPQYDYREVVEKLPRLVMEAPSLKALGAIEEKEGRYLVSNAWIAQAIANLYRSEVVVGLLDYEEESDRSFNSAFHFVPFSSHVERYDKRILVPMSEYLPFYFLGSFLAKYGISTFFTPGEKTKIFSGKIPVAPSICFEEGFSNLIREGRVQGAKLFINVTNDAWFPGSRLPREHFNLGRVRAIENGVPLLRACNTGITSAVDSFGRIVGELAEYDISGRNVAGILVAEINPYSYPTIFSFFGNSLILSISGGLLVIFAFGQSRKRTNLYLLKKD